MNVISEINKEVHSCMGAQSYYPWKTYKQLYILKIDMDGGILLYNLFTREILLLDADDINALEMREESIMRCLVRKWYLIPGDIDRKSVVYSFWQRCYSRMPESDGRISLATIFTTTACNARCPYCYEYGSAVNTMSDETAEQAAEFLIRQAAEHLTVKWFGGEPLVNPSAIDIICRRLSEAGTDFDSSMVSNAYLFDRITDEQITELWKLRRIQITVDGTKEQYLKVKGLPDDSYEKLIRTIKRLARLNVKVNIRTHITSENKDDLLALVNELSDRFRGEIRKYIAVYTAPLFEGLGMDKEILSDEKRLKIYADYVEVSKAIDASGIGNKPGIPGIKKSHCMADSDNSIVITPTGDLTPCEHCHDREICGNISDGYRIPERWYVRSEEEPECADCFYYPQCIRLKLCETNPVCSEGLRGYYKYLAEKQVMNTYERYQRNIIPEVQDTHVLMCRFNSLSPD